MTYDRMTGFWRNALRQLARYVLFQIEQYVALCPRQVPR